jgi:hypothetical protein
MCKLFPPELRGDRRMNESLQKIETIIAACSVEERKTIRRYIQSIAPHPLEKEWGVDAETVLNAIGRSSDLTKRGVRGIIAEAVFETDVMPTIESSGWRSRPFDASDKDLPYDVHLENDSRTVRIQIKLQRLEKGRPKLYYPKHYTRDVLYVVEVQKTRSGKKTTLQKLQGTDTQLQAEKSVTIQTRPYRFGDFDILAVNMHPSSGDWKDFRYTLASWLLPRQKDHSLIEIFQPVSKIPNKAWTEDLATCLTWLEENAEQRVLEKLVHLPKRRP